VAKPKLLLTGRKRGTPTVDDLIALFRQLTGRGLTRKEIRQVRAQWVMANRRK
jgi:hypothetical protein